MQISNHKYKCISPNSKNPELNKHNKRQYSPESPIYFFSYDTNLTTNIISLHEYTIKVSLIEINYHKIMDLGTGCGNGKVLEMGMEKGLYFKIQSSHLLYSFAMCRLSWLSNRR